MAEPRIIIIGAGMAGIACGRALADAGLTPLILDKGRSPGGRMSTRRVGDTMTFDHGAQFFTARGDAFQTAVKAAEAAGSVAPWQTSEPADEPRYVGLPGMSGLAKHLAIGLNVRCDVEVTGIRRSAAGWRLETGTDSVDADIVVCTAPVVQSRNLLGSHGFDDTLKPVSMWPCWAVLLGFADKFEPGFTTRRADGALAWVAQNSSKSGRDGNCWVVHASPEWSGQHLELEKPEAARLLLAMLQAECGPVPVPEYIAGHRWRYAMVRTPLDQPFANAETLYAGGDWALGPRVECAFDSGRAIARDILSKR